LSLEDFFKAHHDTIAALGVIGTFLAIAVALFSSFIALWGPRPRIRGLVSVKRVDGPRRDSLEFLVVTIRNLSVAPIHIPPEFFLWKFPLQRPFFPWYPLESDEWGHERRDTVQINGRGSETFFLYPLHVFKERAAGSFAKTVFGRLRLRFLSFVVLTEEGKFFKVKLDRTIRNDIRLLLREAGK
jgi:hypothetical protein